jgi:hypothetical protein
LQASFARLEAGDTLNVRGGNYCEDRLILEAEGTPEQRIVIRSAPDEATVSIAGEGCLTIYAKGGLEGPEESWQRVDDELEIYRLKNPPSSELTGGWLMGGRRQLVPYADKKLFESRSYGVGGFIGPGFFLDKGELRIRLQLPKVVDSSTGTVRFRSIERTDPNLHSFFFSSGKGPTLTIRKSAHVLLKDLELAPGDRRTVEITGGAHHITFENCSVLVRTIGVVAQEGTHDLAIRDCRFQMGFPPWVAWGDVKGGSRGAGFNPADDAGWNSFAIVGVWTTSVIERSMFLDCFDGIFLRSGSENVVISDNSIVRSRDDAIDLAPDVSKIDISHNVLWRCFEGISLVGEKGGGDAGDVFIHHNVIDVSARHFAERKEDAAYFKSEWSPGIAFGRHDCGRECEEARWRLYNNTIVARGKNKIVPVDMPLAILTNNLLVDLDEPPTSVDGKGASEVLDRQKIEQAELSEPDDLRENYRPIAPKEASDEPSPGSSSWPEFDSRTVGAIQSQAPKDGGED